MIHGINLHPVLPLRKEPAEQSEMISQLLFGECFSVLEEREKWLRIINLSDSYEGWADRKMITPLGNADFEAIEKEATPTLVQSISLQCENPLGESIILPAGSRLFFYNKETNAFGFPAQQFRIQPDNFPACHTTISATSSLFLNAPYLWGGKTIFGIDCSGFTQVVFALCGIFLPRDAYQQAQCGESIFSLQDAKPDDLLFFVNPEGRISHVGILLDNRRIIHASGRVKIDKIDDNGIIAGKEYTHKLHSIKRIING
jgi:cell wall-associated NlpC family hydrolase